MVKENYGEPLLLSELFSSENPTLLNDLRQCCSITNADFAKLQLRFNRVYSELRDGGKQHHYEYGVAQQENPEADPVDMVHKGAETGLRRRRRQNKLAMLAREDT